MAVEGLVDRILQLKRRCRFDEEIGMRFGLSPREVRGILVLARVEELGCGELAGRMGLSPSRASRVIQKLGERGYLSRRRNPLDRRGVTISLTDKGRQLCRLLELACADCEQRLRSRFSAAQLDKVRKGLEILLAHL